MVSQDREEQKEHRQERGNYLKFDTEFNGKPVKSRLPVFCLYVVYLLDLIKEKNF